MKDSLANFGTCDEGAIAVTQPDDWRIDLLSACKDLQGARLRRKSWSAPRPGWDHDHCSVCTAKIWDKADICKGEFTEGYATGEDFKLGVDYEWVCIECFRDFKERMGWQDVT